jgi:hypothetical protein
MSKMKLEEKKKIYDLQFKLDALFMHYFVRFVTI